MANQFALYKCGWGFELGTAKNKSSLVVVMAELELGGFWIRIVSENWVKVSQLYSTVVQTTEANRHQWFIIFSCEPWGTVCQQSRFVTCKMRLPLEDFIYCLFEKWEKLRHMMLEVLNLMIKNKTKLLACELTILDQSQLINKTNVSFA